MSERLRNFLFLPAAGLFGAVLLWGLYGLPSFGDYPGP